MSQIHYDGSPRASDGPDLIDSVEVAYDVMGTKNETWVRYRRGVEDLQDVTQDAQLKAWANPSVKWFVVKRTITVTEELIEVEPEEPGTT